MVTARLLIDANRSLLEVRSHRGKATEHRKLLGYLLRVGLCIGPT